MFTERLVLGVGIEWLKEPSKNCKKLLTCEYNAHPNVLVLTTGDLESSFQLAEWDQVSLRYRPDIGPMKDLRVS